MQSLIASAVALRLSSLTKCRIEINLVLKKSTLKVPLSDSQVIHHKTPCDEFSRDAIPSKARLQKKLNFVGICSSQCLSNLIIRWTKNQIRLWKSTLQALDSKLFTVWSIKHNVMNSAEYQSEITSKVPFSNPISLVSAVANVYPIW